MVDWPHSPPHRVSSSGVYMVTAATYQKRPIFNSAQKLDFLQKGLLEVCEKHQARLEAWAVFPNHYHFIGTTWRAGSIRTIVSDLHAFTARGVNRIDGINRRQVWFQYWDTLITVQRAYFARRRYVHENAVGHGVARDAASYRWCSAGWFERKTTPSFRKTISSFPIARLQARDDFDVDAADLLD
jgi:putative transposase